MVVSAPLRLTNQLPVGGSLLVWEQQPGAGRELVGRQTVQVASGATVPIHTGGAGQTFDRWGCSGGKRYAGMRALCGGTTRPMHAEIVHDCIVRGCSSVPFHAGLSSAPDFPTAADMRQAVSFTFYPEGYEWVEPQPTVLSEGHAGGHIGWAGVQCVLRGFALRARRWVEPQPTVLREGRPGGLERSGLVGCRVRWGTQQDGRGSQLTRVLRVGRQGGAGQGRVEQTAGSHGASR